MQIMILRPVSKARLKGHGGGHVASGGSMRGKNLKRPRLSGEYQQPRSRKRPKDPGQGAVYSAL
jgi:hypothetical protein